MTSETLKRIEIAAMVVVGVLLMGAVSVTLGELPALAVGLAGLVPLSLWWSWPEE